MKRFLYLVSVFLACTLLFIPWSAGAQYDFSQVEIKVIPVTENIYLVQGAGGNIGVSVGKDGIVLVDTQFAPLAEKIRQALRKVTDGEIKYVLNTHWHSDHTNGNVAFGPQALIIAQDNVYKRLATEQKVLSQVVKPLPEEGLPKITYLSSLTLHLNGEEIRMVHFPNCHSDGDSVVFFTKSNVLHLGDLFFANQFPFVDLGTGGDVENLTKNIEEILVRLPSTVKIIPGHGPLSTKEDLKTYHYMLIQTTDYVQQQIKEGKSLEEIKAKGLPEVWESWGQGFINTDAWISIIYHSFTRKSQKSQNPG